MIDNWPITESIEANERSRVGGGLRAKRSQAGV
jgi:hypothetical protein